MMVVMEITPSVMMVGDGCTAMNLRPRRRACNHTPRIAMRHGRRNGCVSRGIRCEWPRAAER
jgi:hypothetical protein